ncbi:SPOR domain-containing protein [Simiduia curdlanivorans]|uniref:SPOR domain-containing protein n=1 Tax=Simiduia curdlanivorans TaxID=1492769 RepID=A0ABV8VAH9_9GAMM|nr:SPOR domain-containing protein [Simiduia curdlanivorans]MDN3639454.1 SPOR domain-containing protein [Simiduia curdlanivorans]
MDDSVKQRLVGAVVLASVAVIFFPSLFDEPDNRYIGGQSQIPPTPQITPVQIAPAARPEGIEPAKAPEQMYQMLDEPAEPEVINQPSLAEPVQPALSQPSKPEVRLNEDGVLQGWVLQVASFTELKKAEDLRDRLNKAGHDAFIRPLVNSKGQQVVRVFVGPKADKQAMLALKKTVDQSLKVNSLLREFKP